jgi:hypothetical protein
MWPLAIVAMAILSVPQFICGFIASKRALRPRVRRGRR